MNSTPNSSKKALRIFRILSAALVCSLAVACIIAFTVGFEPELRYFRNSPLTIPLTVTAVATVVLALSAFFLFKGKNAALRRESPLRFLAMLPMIAILRLIIHIAIGLITNAVPSPSNDAQATLDPWMIGILVTAAFAVIYSLSEIFRINKAFEIISGFLQILFCILVIAKLYIDFSVEINSPVKLLLQFSATAIILCTMADLRRSFDMCSAPIFCASRLIMLALGSASAIALFAEIIPEADKYGELYSVYPLIFIAFAVKAAVELFTCSLTDYIPEESEPDKNSPSKTADSDVQENAENGTDSPAADSASPETTEESSAE